MVSIFLFNHKKSDCGYFPICQSIPLKEISVLLLFTWQLIWIMELLEISQHVDCCLHSLLYLYYVMWWWSDYLMLLLRLFHILYWFVSNTTAPYLTNCWLTSMRFRWSRLSLIVCKLMSDAGVSKHHDSVCISTFWCWIDTYLSSFWIGPVDCLRW